MISVRYEKSALHSREKDVSFKVMLHATIRNDDF